MRPLLPQEATETDASKRALFCVDRIFHAKENPPKRVFFPTNASPYSSGRNTYLGLNQYTISGISINAVITSMNSASLM